jgi:hypothetical protein
MPKAVSTSPAPVAEIVRVTLGTAPVAETAENRLIQGPHRGFDPSVRILLTFGRLQGRLFSPLNDALVPKGGMTWTLEQIVWCPVLLEDHNDMLEARDLPVSEQRFTEKQQRTSKSEFHPFSGWSVYE